MIGSVTTGGGGLSINGIIEQYKVQAGENISAGDFVTWVSNSLPNTENIQVNYGEQQRVLDTNNRSDSFPWGLQLSENRVILFGEWDSNTAQAIVLKFNDGIIERGTLTTVRTTISSTNNIEAYKLDENNIIIIGYDSYKSPNSSFAYIYTIVDFDITLADSDTGIFQASYSYFSTALYDDNKICVISNSGSYVQGMIITVANNRITRTTLTNLFSTGDSYACRLYINKKRGKLFIKFRNYIHIYSISESGAFSKLKSQTFSEFATTGYDYHFGLFVTENKFMACTQSYQYLRLYTFSDEDNTLTLSKANLIAITGLSSRDQLLQIDSSTFLVQVVIGNEIALNNTNKLNLFILKMDNEDNIQFKLIADNIFINTNLRVSVGLMFLNKTQILSILEQFYSVTDQYSYAYTEYCSIIDINMIPNIKKVTNSKERIWGVAKKSAKSEELVDVFIPEYIN